MTYKLYTDISKVMENSSVEGYLLDNRGNILFKFVKKVQLEDVNNHELYALEKGLTECLRRKILNVDCFVNGNPIQEVFSNRYKDRDIFNKYREENEIFERVARMVSYFDKISFKHKPNKLEGKLSIKNNGVTSKNIKKALSHSDKEINFHINKLKIVNGLDSQNLLEKEEIKDTLVFKLNVTSKNIDILHIQRKNEEIIVKSDESIFVPKGVLYETTLNVVSSALEKSKINKCGLIIMDEFGEGLYSFLSSEKASVKQESSLKTFSNAINKCEKVFLYHDSDIESFVKNLKKTANLPFKLYTDGSLLHEIDEVSIGGYLLNKDGKKVFEFSSVLEGLDRSLAHKFEYFALERGLQECIKRGIHEVDCFGDLKQLMYVGSIKDKNQLEKVTREDSVLKRIIKLKNQFNKINFSYIPRSENKEADGLCRKAILNKFNKSIPKISFDSQSKKGESANLNHIKDFIVFKLDGSGRMVTTHKVHKDLELGTVIVGEEKKFSIDGGRFSKGALHVIANTLNNVEVKKCGIVLLGYVSDMIENYIVGKNPITMEYVTVMHNLTEATKKFDTLLLSKDEAIINAVSHPGEFDESKKHNVDFSSIHFIKIALKALGSPDYQFGKEPHLEACLDAKGGRAKSISAIQRLYFAKIFDILEKEQNRKITEDERIVEIPVLKEQLKKEGINLIF